MELLVGLVLFIIAWGISESFWFSLILVSIVLNTVDIEARLIQYENSMDEILSTDEITPPVIGGVDIEQPLYETQSLVPEFISDQVRTTNIAIITSQDQACTAEGDCFTFRLRKHEFGQVYVCEMNGINCYTLGNKEQ